ncbi:MAG: cob(I)yrinic acid a,c-diamide adenosyltransferase [Candidatus Omnitrophota bacterium]
MIHIYTGNGKGKTTSAFGLAMRACGQGMKVAIFQFLKPKRFLCGEHVSVKKLKGIDLIRFEQAHPMFGCVRLSLSNLKKCLKKDLETAKRAVMGKKYDMVVLDEIINAADQGFISRRALPSLLKSTPRNIELVLTGRGDISDIERYADYITVMVDKKHPFKRGALARRGIEY